MNYIKVTVTTTHDDSDMVSAAMFEQGVEGVSIDDPEDFLDLVKSDVIWDYVDETKVRKNGAVYVSTLIPANDKDFLPRLRNTLACMKKNGIQSGEIMTSTVQSEDWENEWKKYYSPIKLDQITIVPSWIKYDKKDDEVTVTLDPGMAFGTGSHATTRMCLQLMDVAGKDVIDVGCGSGVLGISAAKCGAKSVYMCDIDVQAVSAATTNAHVNDVDCSIELADLINGTRKADFIFANLTADVLMRLAPKIKEHLNTNGQIVVSGIIDTRLDEVVECFGANGYEVLTTLAEDDWRALKLAAKK